MNNYRTFFVDKNGQALGDSQNLFPIPLYKGMEITIHSHNKPFKVIEWKFHVGHPDESTGLTVILE